MAIATKEQSKKKYPSVELKYDTSEALKISIRFAEEAKKNWLWTHEKGSKNLLPTLQKGYYEYLLDQKGYDIVPWLQKETRWIDHERANCQLSQI